MSLKGAARRQLERTNLGRRLSREPRFRAVFFAGVGMTVNVLYACYNGVLGLLNQSAWFVNMFAYYAILSVMRISAVWFAWRHRTADAAEAERLVSRLCGALLIVMSLVLSGMVFISLSWDVAVRYHEIVMISIAAYTFSKLTAAIVRAVRQRRRHGPLLTAIRTVGYAEVAASVLTLQRSMLVSFGEMEPGKIRRMNGLSGAAVCVFVLALGIVTIRGSVREGGENHGKIQAGPDQREDR